MTDAVRQFTPEGNRAFRSFLGELKAAPSAAIPYGLLTDPASSCETSFAATVDRAPNGKLFGNRHQFGAYLVNALRGAPRTEISLNHSLWNWLALYYFDQLCPIETGGERKADVPEVYCLDADYKYNRYYRHMVRAPWMAVSLHPTTSRVILIPVSHKEPSIAVRGEIGEQVMGRQGVFRSAAVLAAVDAMYFDVKAGKPRPRTGGSRGGSPRRLGKILKQFALTFDLEWGKDGLVMDLLPKEFAAWKPKGP